MQGVGKTPMQGAGKTPMHGIGKTPMQEIGKTPMQGVGKTPMQGIGTETRVGDGADEPVQIGTRMGAATPNPKVGARGPARRTPKAPRSTSAEIAQTFRRVGGTSTTSARASRVLQPNRRANRLPNRRKLPNRKVFSPQLFVCLVYFFAPPVRDDRFIFFAPAGAFASNELVIRSFRNNELV